ncbi:MAG: chemotaxis-specific protein-glutamate methyltransferase CheB [Candidatus Tectomicrobia bacterium]|nr:chemotaxis-specific protein-glutamate methyltransferase CheB [Candidatus Tectomicrobia bacterium]
MIKVLIVDDLPVVQELLLYILDSDSDIQVVGIAHNGEEAIEAVKRVKPNIITMDIHMPKMDGFEATRKIMEISPTPIVIVSAGEGSETVATTFKAVEAGALAVVQRPMGIGHPDHEITAKEFVQTVKLMSEVKVVKRWARPSEGRRAEPRQQEEPTLVVPPDVALKQLPVKIKLVAIGASAGGPLVIQTILSKLPKDFPVPIVIVQHMAAGFIEGFVEWLNQTSDLSIHIATHGEQILPGHVYVSPDGFQMKVEIGGKILLIKDEPENGHRPSVSYLFRSVARAFGKNAVGILLTGMGKDGAEELKLMKEKGAVTIVQDKESSLVYGMPGEAIKLDAATYLFPPDGITAALENLVNKK